VVERIADMINSPNPQFQLKAVKAISTFACEGCSYALDLCPFNRLAWPTALDVYSHLIVLTHQKQKETGRRWSSHRSCCHGFYSFALSRRKFCASRPFVPSPRSLRMVLFCSALFPPAGKSLSP
jgi:hypothetical protein